MLNKYYSLTPLPPSISVVKKECITAARQGLNPVGTSQLNKMGIRHRNWGRSKQG